MDNIVSKQSAETSFPRYYFYYVNDCHKGPLVVIKWPNSNHQTTL